MNFGFCDWKSPFDFSIEKGGEVFGHCVFWDTIQSIERVNQIQSKKEGFLLGKELRKPGCKMQVQ
jgi:hypothetical protein